MKQNYSPATIALSKGLKDSGCQFSTCFPGSKSSHFFELLGGKQISSNEKVAYEKAFGMSLAGKRTVCSIKNVGLNVAADPFLNSMLTGVNAGLVLIVVDDVDVLSSQCRMDSRHYFNFFGGLWLEPTSVQQAYQFGIKAFDWSESLDVPIVIRITNQFFDLEGEIHQDEPVNPSKKSIKKHDKFIVHPTKWRKQTKVLKEKNSKIKEFVEGLYQPTETSPIKLVIEFGNCQREAEQLNLESDQIFNVFTYPLPEKTIKPLVSEAESVEVLEQGDDYGFKLISQLIENSVSSKISSNTGIIPTDQKYRVWEKLEKVFKGLKAVNPSYVVSDMTQFTQESTDLIDTCLCLGASLSTASGLVEAGIDYPFVIVGDTTFAHGTAILEVLANQLPLGIIVIENEGAWCTGGQKQLLNNRRIIGDFEYKEVEYNNFSVEQFKQLFSLQKNNYQLAITFVKY